MKHGSLLTGALYAIFVYAMFSLVSCDDKTEYIEVNSIILNTSALELTVGETYQLTATITPYNAQNQKILWTSSNASIANVEMGTVTAIKMGTATITAITDDGNKTATCEVKVNPNNSGGSDSSNDDNNGNVGNEGNADIGDVTGYADLSSDGTANSYIVSDAGNYKFKPTKGNSSTSVGSIVSVEVLWETFGTDVTPSKGDLIQKAAYKDGYIAFVTSDRYAEGNALIAAKDEGGNILWSWHIWMTDYPKEHVYRNNAGTLMDRNLGALSATSYDPRSNGLLYQWGRKDPFLGLTDFAEEESIGIEAASTLEWPEHKVSDKQVGTIEYTISHPTTFIVFDPSVEVYDSEYDSWDQYYDWIHKDSPSVTRWSSNKTIYDPCPTGWRVPDEMWETAGIPVNALSDFKNHVIADHRGFIVGKDYCSHDAWYPASGMRVYWEMEDDKYEYFLVTNFGTYWSVTDQGILYSDGYSDGGSWDGYYDGHSVRCQKE